MHPPRSSHAVAVPASGNQLGPPSTAQPPTPKCCLFILMEAHSIRAKGLTQDNGQSWGSRLDGLASIPPTFLLDPQPAMEFTQVTMLNSSRHWHLTPASSGRQVDPFYR